MREEVLVGVMLGEPEFVGYPVKVTLGVSVAPGLAVAHAVCVTA